MANDMPQYAHATIVNGVIVSVVRVWQTPPDWKSPSDPTHPDYKANIVNLMDVPEFTGEAFSVIGRAAEKVNGRVVVGAKADDGVTKRGA